MKLVFEIPFLGVEVFRVRLDIEPAEPEAVSTVDRAAKGLTRWFMQKVAR